MLIIDALAVLDRDETVDVIVLARGGGSIEDLLPFSDEALCRAVFGCRTPVVSAIGHETDAPLIDYVADVRASFALADAAPPSERLERLVRGSFEILRRNMPFWRLSYGVRMQPAVLAGLGP